MAMGSAAALEPSAAAEAAEVSAMLSLWGPLAPLASEDRLLLNDSGTCDGDDGADDVTEDEEDVEDDRDEEQVDEEEEEAEEVVEQVDEERDR
jgi:hypothetical protein